MDHLAAIKLCLEQKDHSLEEHLEEFLSLCQQHLFLDDCICSSLHSGLNTSTRAQLWDQGSFDKYVGWVLLFCELPITVDIVDNDTSPTPDPALSQTPPDCEDRQHEPTTGNKRDSDAMFKPALMRMTELYIATEPEQHMSDQLCKPTAPSLVEEVLLDYEGIEVSPAYPPTTESECLVITLENCFDFGAAEFLPPATPTTQSSLLPISPSSQW